MTTPSSMARRIAAAQMAAAALAHDQAPLSYGIATEDPPNGGADAGQIEAQRAGGGSELTSTGATRTSAKRRNIFDFCERF